MEKIPDIAFSSRIRLARNVKGYPFPTVDDHYVSDIVKPVYQSLNKLGRFHLYHMGKLSALEKNVLREKHLISTDLTNHQSGAALISEDERISVMVNEEDHIREQCLMPGFRLEEAFSILDKVDDALSDKIEFAYDTRYGYLTSCPTNVGTGMRASVMLFLPALTMTRKITAVIHAVSRERITVRGVYGEGSSAEGAMFQLSNQISLGNTESEILRHVYDTVLKFSEAEISARNELLARDELALKDRVRRAYGTLTHAVILSSREFMQLFADVKLGVQMGLLPFQNAGLLDDVVVKMQPANITLMAGRELSPRERDAYRAEYVSKALLSLG